jgi:ribosome-associated toxin RatA of RatAB toxin-antitoxin module
MGIKSRDLAAGYRKTGSERIRTPPRCSALNCTTFNKIVTPILTSGSPYIEQSFDCRNLCFYRKKDKTIKTTFMNSCYKAMGKDWKILINDVL